MSVLINPYALAPVAPAATVEYRAAKTVTASSTLTYSVPDVDIGSAAVGRYVFLAISWATTSGSNKALESATIGGVAATIHIAGQNNHSSVYTHTVIISAPLDAGTTTTVELTFVSGFSASRFTINSYKVTGLLSLTPLATDDDDFDNNSSRTVNVDVEEGGVVIVSGYVVGNSAYNYSGATENYDLTVATNVHVTGASLAVSADEVGRAITLSRADGSGANGVIVAVSLR